MTSNICVGPQGHIQVASAVPDDTSDVSFTPPKEVPKKSAPTVVMHPVNMLDTLAQLAVRYDTTAEVIQRDNRIRNIDLCPPGTVLKITPGSRYPGKSVENPEASMIDKRRDAVKIMRMMIGMDVPVEEVEFYLKSHDWDVTAAMKERKEDMEWERKNPNKKKDEKKKGWW